MYQKSNESHGVKRGSKYNINIERHLSQSDAREENELPCPILGSLSLREPRWSRVTVCWGYAEFLYFVGDAP